MQWFYFFFSLTISSVVKAGGIEKKNTFDENGYILYCPCMGRYGNQADHFLGVLSFAKALNRTLALPPWRTYKNIPFTEFFQVSPLEEYHRVILLEDFLKNLANKHWPVGKRRGYCWLPPQSTAECAMKNGNPFQQFWDELGVDFDDFVIYHLSTDVQDPYIQKEWQEQFPPTTHPVLAFKGAPARYPIIEQNRRLQQYLKWSTSLLTRAEALMKALLPDGPFVGIHLRNGIDWKNACKGVEGLSNFMASPQCLGYSHYRTVTKELCFPSIEGILNQTKTVVNNTKAKSVYVATDSDPLLSELNNSFLQQQVTVVHGNPSIPQLDLIILAKATHFIGNCVSSFTAHVKRERDVSGLPSSFWGHN